MTMSKFVKPGNDLACPSVREPPPPPPPILLRFQGEEDGEVQRVQRWTRQSTSSWSSSWIQATQLSKYA